MSPFYIGADHAHRLTTGGGNSAISFHDHPVHQAPSRATSGSRGTSGISSASADLSFAQAISDTLHADECADWIAHDALRRDRPHPPARHRALPRIAWAITVAVIVLGVAEVVELVGAGL